LGADGAREKAAERCAALGADGREEEEPAKGSAAELNLESR
jgi:hypothetical protein